MVPISTASPFHKGPFAEEHDARLPKLFWVMPKEGPICTSSHSLKSSKCCSTIIKKLAEWCLIDSTCDIECLHAKKSSYRQAASIRHNCWCFQVGVVHCYIDSINNWPSDNGTYYNHLLTQVLDRATSSIDTASQWSPTCQLATTSKTTSIHWAWIS